MKEKIKHWECKECKKEYYTLGWCEFHKRKTNHSKFKQINMELKKNERKEITSSS